MKILNPRRAKSILNLATHSLAAYTKDNHLKTLVLGISGGLDSAVMCMIALQAIERLRNTGYQANYIFDFIGVESQPDDLKKARLLAHEVGFELGEYDYTSWYQDSPIRNESHQQNPRIRVAAGNLKCRLRMLHLYDRAQLFDGVVLDTDDLSEKLMGFWTRHGDVGDVKVIQSLTKEEVRDLGEQLGISRYILNAEPGDGLGVTDTNRAIDQLKMDYLKTDFVISRLMSEGFKVNGNMAQLTEKKYQLLMTQISQEIQESSDIVLHVATQCLKTAFKRKYGDDVLNLLPDRSNMGLPLLGSENFNRQYLYAIRL